MKELLRLENLRTQYHTEVGDLMAVDDVSFTVYEGETLAVVGESGSGKSQTAFTVMQLIPSPPGKILGGKVWFKGRDLLQLPEDEMRKVRGNEISMIFQEPMTSLNPVHTIGKQIAEVLIVHGKADKKQAMERARELLVTVGIPEADKRLHEYPHQLSGGMRQRVMIAMALACSPDLLIADEPTTALDVTIQAQILAEMERLKHETNMSIMLITHDLGVVAELADRIVIMYAGQVVEIGTAAEIFTAPRHPYTSGLLQSVPRLDSEQEFLPVIEGNVPDPLDLPSGCRFHPRCPYAQDICKIRMPELSKGERPCRCFFPLEENSNG